MEGLPRSPLSHPPEQQSPGQSPKARIQGIIDACRNSKLAQALSLFALLGIGATATGCDDGAGGDRPATIADGGAPSAETPSEATKQVLGHIEVTTPHPAARANLAPPGGEQPQVEGATVIDETPEGGELTAVFGVNERIAELIFENGGLGALTQDDLDRNGEVVTLYNTPNTFQTGILFTTGPNQGQRANCRVDGYAHLNGNPERPENDSSINAFNLRPAPVPQNPHNCAPVSWGEYTWITIGHQNPGRTTSETKICGGKVDNQEALQAMADQLDINVGDPRVINDLQNIFDQKAVDFGDDQHRLGTRQIGCFTLTTEEDPESPEEARTTAVFTWKEVRPIGVEGELRILEEVTTVVIRGDGVSVQAFTEKIGVHPITHFEFPEWFGERGLRVLKEYFWNLFDTQRGRAATVRRVQSGNLELGEDFIPESADLKIHHADVEFRIEGERGEEREN